METSDLTYSVYPLCRLFGIKANSMEDAHHLINAIKKYFKLSVEWEGQNYLGLTLDWKYTKKYDDISIPGYIPTTFIVQITEQSTSMYPRHPTSME